MTAFDRRTISVPPRAPPNASRVSTPVRPCVRATTLAMPAMKISCSKPASPRRLACSRTAERWLWCQSLIWAGDASAPGGIGASGTRARITTTKAAPLARANRSQCDSCDAASATNEDALPSGARRSPVSRSDALRGRNVVCSTSHSFQTMSPRCDPCLPSDWVEHVPGVMGPLSQRESHWMRAANSAPPLEREPPPGLERPPAVC